MSTTSSPATLRVKLLAVVVAVILSCVLYTLALFTFRSAVSPLLTLVLVAALSGFSSYQIFLRHHEDDQGGPLALFDTAEGYLALTLVSAAACGVVWSIYALS